MSMHTVCNLKRWFPIAQALGFGGFVVCPGNCELRCDNSLGAPAGGTVIEQCCINIILYYSFNSVDKLCSTDTIGSYMGRYN